jgi:predicted metal-binding membrane protein
VIALSWSYLLLVPMPDNGMGGMAMMEPMAMPWSPDYALLMFAMWALMMAAMMLPAAAPTILLVAALARRQETQAQAPVQAGFFAAGYLTVWIGFSLAAAALQWSADRMAMLTPDMRVASTVLSGAILLTAGIYQWTPLKRTCLSHCRSPVDAIARFWRPGKLGALGAGFRHGLYCLGCCTALMGLLFAGGIMNLAWIAGLALLILVEKVAPGGDVVSRMVGVGLAIWGGVAIAAALFA